MHSLIQNLITRCKKSRYEKRQFFFQRNISLDDRCNFSFLRKLNRKLISNFHTVKLRYYLSIRSLSINYDKLDNFHVPSISRVEMYDKFPFKLNILYRMIG